MMASRKELVGALGALLRRIAAADTLADVQQGSVLDNAARVYQSALRGIPAPMSWTPLRQVPYGTVTAKQIADGIRSSGLSEAEVRAMFDRIKTEETLWVNSIYQVCRRDMGNDGVHLSIKRIDQEVIHDWRDLQRIKNELVGPECEAVELYPAETRKTDTANQYHLWCVDDPAYRFGLGFNERRIDSGKDASSHLQRPLLEIE